MKHSLKDFGFTLIEVLVVISIIGLLFGILFAVGNSTRDTARAQVTNQRIEQVLTGLRLYAADGGSPALSIQRYALSCATTTGWAGNTGGTTVDVEYPGTFTLAGNASSTGLTGTGPSGSKIFGSNSNFRTVDVNLADFNPLKTLELLALSGVCADSSAPAANTTDPTLDANTGSSNTAMQVAITRIKTIRSQKAAWNDGWGNPLIVGYGLYMALDQTAAQSAFQVTKYSRCVYASVGALGSSKKVSFASGTWTTGGSNALLQQGWDTVNAVCNNSANDGSASWLWSGKTSFENPPWSGTAQARGKNSYSNSLCLLSAVEEFR